MFCFFETYIGLVPGRRSATAKGCRLVQFVSPRHSVVDKLLPKPRGVEWNTNLGLCLVDDNEVPKVRVPFEWSCPTEMRVVEIIMKENLDRF